MNRPTQKIDSVQKDQDTIQHMHPAFTLIGASRVSGGVKVMLIDILPALKRPGFLLSW